jgi:bifunctional non-homologous end joining protein LigD
VRAVVGATVSTPLAWDEVDHRLDPRAFTMKTVPERIAKLGDPMRGLLTAKPDVSRAVARLSDLVVGGRGAPIAPKKRSGRGRDR